MRKGRGGGDRGKTGRGSGWRRRRRESPERGTLEERGGGGPEISEISPHTVAKQPLLQHLYDLPHLFCGLVGHSLPVSPLPPCVFNLHIPSPTPPHRVYPAPSRLPAALCTFAPCFQVGPMCLTGLAWPGASFVTLGLPDLYLSTQLT